MQFVDEACFFVRAGPGGDGSVSFNRAKYKPRGGPDGGRGGDGGSVIFRASQGLRTLEPYVYRRLIKAGRGRHGSGKNRTGEKGADVITEGPVGTLVYEDDGLLADLSKPGNEFVAAKGGQGGRGNASFATSTRQAPAFSEKGLPGEEKEIRLELRVLSDVGLVGLPNAGKSSLLSAISSARPKIGDYPFTTLTPALGVVDGKIYREPFVVADIPGLIPGASEGKGLGNRFLRHVARAHLLVLVIDASEDPEGAEATLRTELYAASLSKKPVVVVLNKVDMLDDELRGYLRGAFPDAVQVSALSGEGVKELEDLLEKVLRTSGERKHVEANELRKHRVFKPVWKGMRVERVEKRLYKVSGEEVERLALKTDWNNPESVAHLQRELERKGVVAALKRAGVKPGDEVRVGVIEFEFR